MSNGSWRLELDSVAEIKKRHKLAEAQQYVDSEVLRLCTPLVPMDTGELIRSGIRETRIGTGQVIYNTPYSRRWYYEPANFQGAPMRGNYWFERMKNNGGKQSIARGVASILGISGRGK